VGELVSAKGIAEGVSNSNWLIETTSARFILTMYERRIDLADLPFFLDLMDHLSAKGCPVPRTIHDCEGASYRLIDGKAVALIEYLPGVSVDHPTPAQAHSVGIALAQMHLAVGDFGQSRANDLDLATCLRMLDPYDAAALAQIDLELPEIVAQERESLGNGDDTVLPGGVVHCDLFPDNVLMRGETVGGLIDFYFAATDSFAYDLAVTHAAWSFTQGGHDYRADVGAALVSGYQSVRTLSSEERASMIALLRRACVRFIASRTEDWITTPPGALVTRKDPMDFARRLQFYRDNSAGLFA
jgi:homoserine kinase type II